MNNYKIEIENRSLCRFTDNIKYFLFMGVICTVYVLFIIALPFLQKAGFIPAIARIIANTVIFGLTIIFLVRYIIALLHRTRKTNNLYRPIVSILIPVKDEEEHISKTIAACYKSKYPTDLIEVVVINDGSTDNTASEIDTAQKRWPGMKVLHLSKNVGKRSALVKGLEVVSGEIVVMIDSDTFVESDALSIIVQHFTDRKIGAVSGHTNVYNQGHNLLTRLQEYKYHIAHRMFKSFESVFNAVTCCPGCFSAFRMEYLKPLISRWTSKRFFGMDCTNGEDRSLTALMLQNHRVTYEPNSVACTIVPTTIGSYLKQQLRWIQSFFRESLYLGRFMWKKHPLAAFSFYLSILLSFAAPATLLRELLIYPILLHYFPMFFLLAVTAGIILMALFSILTGKARYMLHVLGYTSLYMGVIVWMIPVALLSLRSNVWGGRGADAA